MFVESLICLLLIGAILVFFYRQATTEFHILQVESFQKALPILQERSPIVVHPFDAMPSLWSRADFDQRPQIYALPIGSATLKERLEPSFKGPQTSPQEASAIADQVGLPLWSQEQILQQFKESVWWSPLASQRVEAYVGAIGLRPTYAHATLLVCTEGELSVSLMTQASDVYLPSAWQGRQVKDITRNDTPHLDKLQYIDIVLYQGSAVILPPHWRVCATNHILSVDAKQPLSVWVELHHPISRLVEHVALQRI